MRMSLISSPLSDIRKRSSTITAEKSSALINPSRSMEDNPRFKTLKNFYKNHKDGPDELVDRIILKFTQLVFREMSLRNSYEDLMNQVLSKTLYQFISYASMNAIFRKSYVRTITKTD